MTKIMNILIIDDNEDDRILSERSLLKSGVNYVVHEAEDGDEGLQVIQEIIPDCILLDYSLPRQNGIEVLKRIRSQYQFLPVLMLTGQGNETVAVSAMQQGAQNYITKSDITPESLHHAVQMAIKHCTLQNRINEQRLSLEVFTHALAHDLKEPIRTVLSFMELIDDKSKLSNKSQGYFHNIQSAAERMTTLIDTVHLYTKLDTADKLKIETCNTKEVVNQAVSNIHQLIKESDAEVKINTLPHTLGNQVQLTQLFQNLICNAIKHNKPGVEINVGCNDKGDSFVFYVRDNGAGIKAEALAKIFDPFQRSSDHDHQGLGMGLAICKKIIDSHRGRIWCESRLGEGTTFYFSIPKKMPKTENRTDEVVSINNVANTEAKPTFHNKPANILLVDDNKMDIELTKIMLFDQPNMKCNVNVATDGQQALDIMRSSANNGNKVDLVMMDINMPKMNGFECLEEIRKDTKLKDTPVVICTTSAYDKDERQAKNLGVSGYIVKPARFNMMKNIIDKIPALLLSQRNDTYELFRAGNGA